MQVHSNAPAFTVWKTYTQNVTNLRDSMAKLSSGAGILSAGDDPAGLAMSERMRAQFRNSAAAAGNLENAVSYFQTSDSWLQKIHDIFGRMAELAIAANDGTKSTVDRSNLQAEFEQMQTEIRRITDGATTAAKYNGRPMFHGDKIALQVGPDSMQIIESEAIDLRSVVSIEGSTLTIASTASLGSIVISTDGTLSKLRWGSLMASTGNVLSIGTASAAGVAIGAINMGIDFISDRRATIGAQQSRMAHTLEGLRHYEDNMRAAESRIRDVDVARETTEFAKYQILTQIGTAMLAQANALPQGVMGLMG